MHRITVTAWILPFFQSMWPHNNLIGFWGLGGKKCSELSINLSWLPHTLFLLFITHFIKYFFSNKKEKGRKLTIKTNERNRDIEREWAMMQRTGLLTPTGRQKIRKKLHQSTFSILLILLIVLKVLDIWVHRYPTH